MLEARLRHTFEASFTSPMALIELTCKVLSSFYQPFLILPLLELMRHPNTKAHDPPNIRCEKGACLFPFSMPVVQRPQPCRL